MVSVLGSGQPPSRPETLDDHGLKGETKNLITRMISGQLFESYLSLPKPIEGVAEIEDLAVVPGARENSEGSELSLDPTFHCDSNREML